MIIEKILAILSVFNLVGSYCLLILTSFYRGTPFFLGIIAQQISFLIGFLLMIPFIRLFIKKQEKRK